MHKIFLPLLIFLGLTGFSQHSLKPSNLEANTKSALTIDSAKVKYNLNPLTSSLLSTCIPGAGQIYNRKYWKAPIVWAGGLYLLYTYDGFRRKHLFYHQILVYKDRYTSNEYIIPYAEEYGKEFTEESAEIISALSKNDIQLRNDQAKKNKQRVIIGSLVFYLLQIVDATVDAHFDNFNVSEDLSFNISPANFQMNPFAQGVKLSFNF